MTRLRAVLRRVRASLAATLGLDEILLLLALGLLAGGAWMVWRPAAFFVPGLVILWLVLPSRAPFLARPDPKTEAPAASRRS